MSRMAVHDTGGRSAVRVASSTAAPTTLTAGHSTSSRSSRPAAGSSSGTSTVRCPASSRRSGPSTVLLCDDPFEHDRYAVVNVARGDLISGLQHF
jgi:hypothetical protein